MYLPYFILNVFCIKCYYAIEKDLVSIIVLPDCEKRNSLSRSIGKAL